MEYILAILFGIVEGITEWLPVSSTGHMILLEEWLDFPMSAAFMEMFLVVIQLGAILAVVVLFWKKLSPYSRETGWDASALRIWPRIAVACVPAAAIEIFAGGRLEAMFYNYQTVAIMLVAVGIAFLLVEGWIKDRVPAVGDMEDISYIQAFLVGVFQMIAAVFPGTSRSGATIIGGLCLGLSRKAATEFTFFLAVPVMFGASLIKVAGFGWSFTCREAMVLLLGMSAAFIVSILVIRFLIQYVQKSDFRIFGWYRVVLGILIFLLFFSSKYNLVTQALHYGS